MDQKSAKNITGALSVSFSTELAKIKIFLYTRSTFILKPTEAFFFGVYMKKWMKNVHSRN